MSRRALLITCIASLVVNLGFIGFFVGKTIFFDSRVHHSFFRTSAPVERLLKSLGDDRASELQSLTRKFRRDSRKHYEELRLAQHEIYHVMTDKDIDRQKLAEAQEEFNELFIAAKKRQDQLWLTLATELTADERRRILEISMPHRHREGLKRSTGREQKIPNQQP